MKAVVASKTFVGAVGYALGIVLELINPNSGAGEVVRGISVALIVIGISHKLTKIQENLKP